MSEAGLDLQREWDAGALAEGWPSAPDGRFVYQRLQELPALVTGRDATGRVLEVAAAEAVHSCKLSLQGLDAVVVEPSPLMLATARERMTQLGAHLTLIRGIGEALPFRDATFDRVLCESAIDHFAGPDLGVREMVRVCKPDGRLVIGAVNYGSLAVRLSRLVYRVGHGLRRVPPTRRFWDTPVPYEHTFECSHGELMALCGRYCDLDEVVGVSMGWAVPGWGRFLARLPERRAATALRMLDGVARRVPRWADYVLTVWTPRPRPTWSLPANASRIRVAAHDPAYRWKIRFEAAAWDRPPAEPEPPPPPAVTRAMNTWLTGQPERSWLEDLVARGPFTNAAALGCDDDDPARKWVHARGSVRLDVYELSAGTIRRSRRGLPRTTRFIRTDLNFARLPRDAYEVIWSSGTLHHVVNLELLFDEVERALRPGGLFALFDYVGESRFRYEPGRLARANAALRDVPVAYRRDAIETIEPPPFAFPRGAFCGVRSADVLAIARTRFDVVHHGAAGALYPLLRVVDLPALARDAPDVLAGLLAAEDAALRDSSIRPCLSYVVYRRR